MARLLFPLLIACLLVVLAPAAASAAPIFGVYAEDGLSGDDAAAERQRAAGLDFVRVPFTWEAIEPVKGRFQWDRTDAAVETAASGGIFVLPFLVAAPKWSSGSTETGPTQGAYPPRDVGDFAAFTTTTAAVARYGARGSFWKEHPDLPIPAIRAWQVWNEPNLRVFWRPEPDAAAYVKLLRAGSQAIRKADPGAIVVAAGIPEARIDGTPLPEFLQAMYNAGARGTFDALAVHAYQPDVPQMFGTIALVRHVGDRNGDAEVPLWVTEFGWATDGDGPSGQTVTEREQAQLISDAVLGLRSRAEELTLGIVSYFNWRDPVRPSGSRDIWLYHTGLLRTNGSAKPALEAMSDALPAPSQTAAGGVPGAPAASAAGLFGPLGPGTTGAGTGARGSVPATLRVALRATFRGRAARRRALRVSLRCSRSCGASLVFKAGRQHVSGRWRRRVAAGRTRTTRLRVSRSERRWLAAHPRQKLTVSLTATTPDGGFATAVRAVR